MGPHSTHANRPPAPGDGCCGCNHLVADVYVTAGRAAGEAYCWRCVDAWPVDVTVFPGRERKG